MYGDISNITVTHGKISYGSFDTLPWIIRISKVLSHFGTVLDYDKINCELSDYKIKMSW